MGRPAPSRRRSRAASPASTTTRTSSACCEPETNDLRRGGGILAPPRSGERETGKREPRLARPRSDFCHEGVPSMEAPCFHSKGHLFLWFNFSQQFRPSP